MTGSCDGMSVCAPLIRLYDRQASGGGRLRAPRIYEPIHVAIIHTLVAWVNRARRISCDGVAWDGVSGAGVAVGSDGALASPPPTWRSSILGHDHGKLLPQGGPVRSTRGLARKLSNLWLLLGKPPQIFHMRRKNCDGLVAFPKRK